MNLKDRIAIVEKKLAMKNTHQSPEYWSETEKIEWLEQLEAIENEHHVLLQEISIEINPTQHQEKGFRSLDVTDPWALTQLEASGQREQEIDAIKEQQRQIMSAEKNIIW